MRAKLCTGIAERYNICNECNSLRSNSNLFNKIIRKIPSINNIKFTPKHYWEDNALKKHLQNLDLHAIWNLLNDNCNDTTTNSWINLADKALKGAFKEKPIFNGLCEVMCDAVERKSKNQGKQCIKYSEEFTNFLVILG